MKTAVLLVSFGTSHQDAKESSLDRIYEDIKAAAGEAFLCQAYTSGMILRKLEREKKQKIFTVEEALKAAIEQQAECLYVIPTHMIAGEEYHKMEKELFKYREAFCEIKIASAVLAARKDCETMVSLLRDMLEFREEREYILMGHGSEAAANIRYAQMNEAFEEAGLFNVRIASVEAKPDLEDAILALKTKEEKKEIELHPFMVVAGDHAKNDMAGKENSYVGRLTREGYQARAVVKGLGEYPQFRRLYVEKLLELLK